MHGVFADVVAMKLADRPGVGLLRIRRTHHLSVMRHGVVALQDSDHDGRPRHELDELTEERPCLVNGIKAFGHLP